MDSCWTPSQVWTERESVTTLTTDYYYIMIKVTPLWTHAGRPLESGQRVAAMEDWILKVQSGQLEVEASRYHHILSGQPLVQNLCIHVQEYQCYV